MDYSRVLSRTVTGLKKSGIRKFFDLLGDMKDVVSLTVGQPDFVTPWHIREAGIESLEKGKTYYTSTAGLPELRTEICRYMARRFGLAYEPDETVVTVGGSEAIDLCIRALVEPGDTRTGFTKARTSDEPEGSPYFGQCRTAVDHMARDEPKGKSADSVARVFLKLARRKNPPVRCAVGLDYKALAFLTKVLPARLVNFIIKLIYLS